MIGHSYDTWLYRLRQTISAVCAVHDGVVEAALETWIEAELMKLPGCPKGVASGVKCMSRRHDISPMSDGAVVKRRVSPIKKKKFNRLIRLAKTKPKGDRVSAWYIQVPTADVSVIYRLVGRGRCWLLTV